MSFADQDGYIWMDGEYVEWRDAKIHILTHTLHYGVGVFEGVRAYSTDKGPAMFRLHEHTARLFASAHIMVMKIPYDMDTLNDVQCEVFRRNDLESGYVRPIVYYGSEAMGLHAKTLKVHVSVAAWPWGAYLGEDAIQKGIRVKTSSFARHFVNSTMCKAKVCGHYYNSIMALQEAEAAGYDEALMLDSQGYVAEGSGENLFLVRKNKVYTPDLTSVLEGITRDTVITLIEDEIGIPVIEKRITRDEVYTADEAFFTGTAAEVTPIRELDDRTVGSGEPGEVTRRLQELYFDQVHGRREKHADWLTYV
jgi:branched-chain amino acid aminotransferase